MLQTGQSCLNVIASPRSHINGSEASFTNGVWSNIAHNHKCNAGANADKVMTLKGAQVISTACSGYQYSSSSGVVTINVTAGVAGANGILMVHLVEDADNVFTALELKAGDGPVYAQFDVIGDSTKGSTVAFNNQLQLFPEQYNQETLP